MTAQRRPPSSKPPRYRLWATTTSLVSPVSQPCASLTPRYETNLPTLSPVDGWHLIVWSAAEASTTIMAASIPVLRVLFRDVHHSRRYGSSSQRTTGRRHPTAPTATMHSHHRTATTVTVSAAGSRRT